MRNELEVANHYGLILCRSLLKTPEIYTHWRGGLRDVRCVRGIRLGFDHLGNFPDGLSAVHQREHDVVREPLKPRRREGSSADAKVVFPCRNSLGLAMTGG